MVSELTQQPESLAAERALVTQGWELVELMERLGSAQTAKHFSDRLEASRRARTCWLRRGRAR